MSNSFFDKKPGIITILVLVVLAVLVVFAFEFKLGNINKPSMYSASGRFEKLAFVPPTDKNNSNGYLQIYFISDYDHSEKIGQIGTGTHFYVLTTKNGKTTTETGNYASLKKGDRVVAFSAEDISKIKNFILSQFELIK